MKLRIAATIGVLALWSLFWLSSEGSLPTIVAYVEQLQRTSAGDRVMQALMNDHMRQPVVLSLMLFAVLWVPVVENKLYGSN